MSSASYRLERLSLFCSHMSSSGSSNIRISCGVPEHDTAS